MSGKDPIYGKPFFKIGQRVRPSREGQDGHIFMRKHWNTGGVVTKVDRFNSPTVLWDHRRTPSSYAALFIDIDRRRAKP